MIHFDLLGCKVKERVTGFVGIVASVSYDLYGCVQCIVTPPMGSDGKVQDSHWFDAKRLDVITSTPVMTLPNFQVERASGEPPRGAAEKPVMRRQP